MVPCFCLELLKFFSDIVEDVRGKFIALSLADITADNAETGLVGADNADGGEVVFPIFLEAIVNLAQIILGIRVESLGSVVFEYLTLDLKTGAGNL